MKPSSSSSSSSSPRSLRDRLTIFPPFSRLRNRLWTEETLLVRNNHRRQDSPGSAVEINDGIHHPDNRNIPTGRVKADEGQEEEKREIEPVMWPAEGDDAEHDDRSMSDVSTLSNVSQYHLKLAWHEQSQEIKEKEETPPPPLPREIEIEIDSQCESLDDDNIPEWLLISSRSLQQNSDELELIEQQFLPPPPPPLETYAPFLPRLVRSEPSAAIPRPTLCKHKSAPAITEPTSQYRIERPPHLTVGRRPRTTWTQSDAGVTHHHVASQQSVLSHDASSSALLGNRERYRGSGSSRSVATLSVGSLVGQSSWVTAPAATTVTSSSNNNPTSITTTTISSSSVVSDMGLGDIHERNWLRRSRRRIFRGDDLKRVLLLSHIRLLRRKNTPTSTTDKVNLQRSSGCLT